MTQGVDVSAAHLALLAAWSLVKPGRAKFRTVAINGRDMDTESAVAWLVSTKKPVYCEASVDNDRLLVETLEPAREADLERYTRRLQRVHSGEGVYGQLIALLSRSDRMRFRVECGDWTQDGDAGLLRAWLRDYFLVNSQSVAVFEPETGENSEHLARVRFSAPQIVTDEIGQSSRGRNDATR